MRRVLFVSTLWPPRVLGGAELYASALASRLKERGCEVGAVTLGVDGADVVASVRPWPVRWEEFGSANALDHALLHVRDLYSREARMTVERAIREFRPDVVHSHSVAGLSGAVLATPSRLGVPHVHTLHDYWLLCQRMSMVKRSGTACERRCASCIVISMERDAIVRAHPPDVVTAVSYAVAREHERIPWMRDRLRVVPNPVEPVPTVARTPGSPVTFGYIGQVTRHKGVPTLVEAFTGADTGDARLLIAGTGPVYDELSTRTPPSIEWLGWVDDAGKESFFAAIDCLVVPSEWKDPAPLVVNEARARQIPVIGARIGGIPELVAPESAPLLFPARDLFALRARLESFAAEPSLYAVTTEVPRDNTWSAHLDRMLHAYDDAARSAVARRA
ncbi:MAG TPA: glycosyltransferase [Acidimicrobiia bacterium]|nr:glycosyltransferase [Acidimicrobiia bacterium]